MFRARTSTPESTRELAAALSNLVRPCDLLLLAGDLGAGKTAFTQGFGRGLGVEEHITSPTFTILRSYMGRLQLHHLDVYRIDQLEETLDLGLSELLDDDSVTVIEWGDAILPALPADYLEVRLTYGDGPDDRILELSPTGVAWSARMRVVAETLAPWADSGTAGEPGTTGDGEC